MARPIKYTDEYIEEIIEKLEEYTNDTDIPIIKEFCYISKVPHSSLYEHPEFSDSIKMAMFKKEYQLERKALNNEVNVTMAIFSLKQLGWKDKSETVLSGGVSFTVPKDLDD